jgi:hypothetical protein
MSSPWLPYFVHITDADRAYLAGLPLSDTAKEAVGDFIDYAIARVDDAFRNDPANRTQPDARYFHRDLLLRDKWGDGQFHRVDFFVNDQHAANGVLIIVYVDHQ